MLLLLTRLARSSLARSSAVILQRPAHAQQQHRGLRTTLSVLHFDQDVESVSLFSRSKKYFVDVKQNEGGKNYLKISELSKGSRFTLMVQAQDVAQFCSAFVTCQEASTEFVGSSKIQYTFERRQNAGGQYVHLVETHPDGRVHRISIPDEAHVQILKMLSKFSAKYFPAAA